MSATEQTGPLEVRSNDGLGPLVPCPMCDSRTGYALKDGSTYRWWDVFCVNCGRTVDECASDRRTQLGTDLPDRWPDADTVWNAAGEHAQKLRIGFERYETARRMSPRQWADALKLNISTGKPFDEIVDNLRPFVMPNVRIQRTDAAGGFGPAGENVDSPTDGPKTPAVAGTLQ